MITLMPISMREKLDCIQRDFLWEGRCDKRKLYLIKWSKVIQPKDDRGQGFRNLGYKNWALLAKWWWRFRVAVNKGLWLMINMLGMEVLCPRWFILGLCINLKSKSMSSYCVLLTCLFVGLKQVVAFGSLVPLGCSSSSFVWLGLALPRVRCFVGCCIVKIFYNR